MIAELAPPSQSRIVDRSLIEEISRDIAHLPLVESEVTHRFTPGLYTRQILMKAGTRHLSKIHRTRHQYIVSQGACLVSENGAPTVMLIAPYHGFTEPGTWRQLFIIMDCLWTTMHAGPWQTVEEVEAAIIEPMEDKK